MKKLRVLNGVKVKADNAGEKKLLSGCKFCIETFGKCCEAEKMYNHISVLSAYSPYYHGSKLVVKDPKEPLEFPLWCFRNFAAEVLYCEKCDVSYKSRYNTDTKDYDISCPICGSNADMSNTHEIIGAYCTDCGFVFLESYLIRNNKLFGYKNCPCCGQKGEYILGMLYELYPGLYPDAYLYTDDNDPNAWLSTYYDELVGFYDEDCTCADDFFNEPKLSKADIKEALALVESIYVDK